MIVKQTRKPYFQRGRPPTGGAPKSSINFFINILNIKNKMKKYIKPETKVVLINLENSLLAGSASVGISEDPATGPALSKGNNFFDDEDDDE